MNEASSTNLGFQQHVDMCGLPPLNQDVSGYDEGMICWAMPPCLNTLLATALSLSGGLPARNASHSSALDSVRSVHDEHPGFDIHELERREPGSEAVDTQRLHSSKA